MAGYNDDCTGGGGRGQSEPTDNSSSFTRWSRNLSAHRQRELNRLNQIEKSRRLLELKSQNHLFDQMSTAVNDSNNNDINGPAFSSKFCETGAKKNGSYLSAVELQITPKSTSQTIECHHDKQGDHDKVNPERVAAQQVWQPIESQQSSSKAICGDGDPIKVSSEIDLSTKLRLTSLSSTELVKDESKSKDSLLASGSQEHPLEIATEHAAPLACDSSQPIARTATNASTSSDHMMINKPISREQLAKFVAARVPKNKRAFCMIVRNKMSQINKAKSYFYPTYYLFIQTILDIDDSYRVELSNGPNDSAGELNGTVTTPIDRATLSGDNSFSASSSISADMLLIGSENGANASGMKLTGNSYSDNEVYTNTDTEEDSGNINYKSKTSRITKQQKLKKQTMQTRKSTDSSQGRESPLVHPNNIDNIDVDRGSLLAWVPDKSKSTNVSINVVAGMDAGEDEDGDRADLDEDDSDNDDFNCKEWTGENEPPCDQEIYNESFLESLFDNERNPYSETNGVLLAGRRRKKGKTYLIGPNEYGYTRKNSICKLKSNVLGTQFNAIRLSHADNNINDRCNIVSISYETNVLGFKGPRKMRVFLAKNPNDKTKNLPEMFKRDPEAVVYLKNMTPSWNTESQSYVLNFHGRVTQASVKNFQLIQCESGKHSNNSRIKQLRDDPVVDQQQDHHQQKYQRKQKSFTSNNAMGDRQSYNRQQQAIEAQSASSIRVVNSNINNNKNNHGETDLEDKVSGDKIFTYNSSIVMQFGRISNDEFTCDVTYPLSILQAFAIALSSFDSKLACE